MVDTLKEILKCAESPEYFIHNYVYIYDSKDRGWIPFSLWPKQRLVVRTIHSNQLTILLKARQLGITWIVLGYALWSMLFDPVAEVLLFSRRDDEAVALCDGRLKGMYKRLPPWLQANRIDISNTHTLGLSNSSIARAFPTTAGDSYTATFCMVDEADLIDNFNGLMRAVKPTIDNGGKMVLLSRANKDTPQSEFKQTYRMAVKGQSPWKGLFLPWSAHPGRTNEWYQMQKQDIENRTGALDDLYEQYPSTPEEALLPKSLDKRIPGKWLLACYQGDVFCNTDTRFDSMNEFSPPIKGRKYRIGADPAEGNPTSNDSVLCVVDLLTGEEVANIRGKFQPQILAAMALELHKYYNNAPIMVERNNHGHAVINWFREELGDDMDNVLLKGYDDKWGWLSNTFGKTKMYTEFVELVRTGNVIIHDEEIYNQLSIVDGATLKAPDGESDDCAIAFSLASVARSYDLDNWEAEGLEGGNNTYERSKQR